MINKFTLASLCLSFLSLHTAGQDVADSLRNTFDARRDTTALSVGEVVVSAKQILGSKFKARNRAGSAYYVSPAELQKYEYTDINRMLKSVPGVNIYEEDGYGLRPNISLRGTKAERSERITIMEDGILIAPAPYAAPAAYYFPNAARMHAIEVLKGSSQVQYGPFTTGGAINLVSQPIPTRPTAMLNVVYGTNNTVKLHAMAGGMHRWIGCMVEYMRYQSDGFKHFGDGYKPGFYRNDFLAKLLFTTNTKHEFKTALELKFGYANEVSEETYVGLTEADFATTPFLRYAGSRKDEMRNNHQQYAATWLLDINSKLKFTTSVYYNRFYRNWYKLNDVRIGASSGEKRGIEEVLRDPETNSKYYDILTGAADYDGEALIVRANRRTYHSSGVQIKGEYALRLYPLLIDIEAGLRYHTDEEDRFQHDDSYSMIGGQMSLYYHYPNGSNANRITGAKALAAYILANVRYKRFVLSAGMRYEDVELEKKNYGSTDLMRTGKIREITPNSAHALIPGVSLSYRVLTPLHVFAGIHKGFAPPGAELNQKAESSINVELGSRYYTERLLVELIAFHNDYSNMLGSDLAASGGTGTLDQFSIGEARVQGLEFLLQYGLMPKRSALQLPLQVSYTYTDTKMKTSFYGSSWGHVLAGDEIPYICKHSVNAQVGAEWRSWALHFGANYNSDMRTTPGQGAIAEREKVPARLILDASVRYKLNSKISFSINAINLTNKTYLVSRHPSGLRAGHPFGISFGAKVQL